MLHDKLHNDISENYDKFMEAVSYDIEELEDLLRIDCTTVLIL